VRLGYYVITCDYLPSNPGHQFAHEYYNVSTTDKEAVLALALPHAIFQMHFVQIYLLCKCFFSQMHFFT
ncbi:MAG: hypothetical protein IIV02_02440, partial [Peptococcaceae bacterium]|nr:hypothetical protein [Peptococcaceae bacterium]